ncbi:MAG: phosphoglycerate mutase (2,3-diphosphoglycerate-independent) [Candidatus Doudnabacteria bacterium RIFCSPHIGHO2_02_FULL_48_21]|uniref:2,3-bisphosphoglycerate-independent phosphoglycerate mutase n=1 Tax=Candidatus Doudnabacteria bacterium RIFCSPLOWO2_02_FULL_48_13 TaxID=1817845 RepID=A0A1F5Q8M1_9BACT|nr:MAG: phosphoglycerate mutase (2,3-diphosphoglycerate-independent) [Candidatus Doudnabacteria bacterium RIFCSPHIGHO2_01_48_18]OGE79922.1 MAG: phosphoglycerate mutase (2,3-diphosphoglycerate-independent) [Candidatus Doudnabacteria bacterium RIFCSPHIGHO2_01_FULL_48_180]OGE93954.1 MAG: phosphoglycerate mutase (2,3-diphosphoglycerate-independent) [Candidatus Doudnabacteria bacterium RIFCSPHIGHO2_02_FULL_48_21]OGE97208.1 MAG: phosphoglycerate mutase (2,3-diphosphoglycerate-independent) [Candidatus 
MQDPLFMANFSQLVLIILDGWGWRDSSDHNPIMSARKPFFDFLYANHPHALLEAAGPAVGLPENTIGNSEVGHVTIGAGRVIDTDVVRISKAFATNQAKTNPAFQTLFDHVKKHNSTLHIKGLVSPAKVHSTSEHLYEFLKLAKDAGLKKIVIHAFTDGRDTPPQSADKYMRELEDVLAELGIGRIATVSGRYYAMDRDKNWDRIAKVEHVLFHGKSEHTHEGRPSKMIKLLHEQGKSDEHFEPMIFLDDSGKSLTVGENDGLLFFNFRPDRARQLSQKIIERSHLQNICFVTMTEYDESFQCLVAFPDEKIEQTLSSEISRAGLTQAHIAETEKYAHVTYFLNGGRQQPHPNEEFILIDSRKDIKTHNQAPEMRAREIADEAVKQINKKVNFVVLNFANADMVGHTADFDATVKAIETLDKECKRVVEAALKNNAVTVITADHGNAEISHDINVGQKHTAHTTNPVPVILVGNLQLTTETLQLKNGTLADVAPTILKLLGVKKPDSMTGKNLILRACCTAWPRHSRQSTL